MQHWKTTIPGTLGAFFAFVAFTGQSLQWPQWIVLLSAFAAAGGLATLGVNASQVGGRTLKILICAIVIGSVEANAQVTAVFTPEPMTVLKALNVRDVGLWTVRSCNDGAAAVTLPEERVYMAAPAIHFLAPERALAVIADRQAHSPRAQIVQYIEYGLIASTALTGFGPIAASKTVIASLGLGAGLAAQYQRQMQGEAPSLGPYTDTLLKGPLQLAPGACATRTAFAGKMKGVQTIRAVIQAAPLSGAAIP